MIKLILTLQLFSLFMVGRTWANESSATYRFEGVYFVHDSDRLLNPLTGSMEGFKKLPDHHIHTSYTSGLVWLRGTFEHENPREDYFLVLSSPLTGKITLF